MASSKIQPEAQSNNAVPLALTAANLEIVDDETPRVRDVDLGAVLGFERVRNVRDIIARNSAELLNYGPLPRRAAKVAIGSGAHREVEEFWLSEPQALLVTMFSRTERAAEARREIIGVFLDYRRGLLERPVHVRAYQRSKPSRFSVELRHKRTWAQLPRLTEYEWSKLALLSLGMLALVDEAKAEEIAVLVAPQTRDRDFALTAVQHLSMYRHLSAEHGKALAH